LLTTAAAGLMSSMKRFKTCRLRKTAKKRLVVLIHYSTSH